MKETAKVVGDVDIFAYKLTSQEVVDSLQSNVKEGLTDSRVLAMREKHGLNELQENKKEPWIIKFLKQFADVLIIILLIAAVVSLIVEPSEWVDSLVIFIVVMLNAILGVTQESKAEKSLEALKKMSSPNCKVLRNGKVNQIPSNQLVVGDIILVEAGDFIPADARLIDAVNLQVDESALTGESLPVIKHVDAIMEDTTALGDRKNMLFSSTFITGGRGKAVVTSTGMSTEIGKIAGMLNSQKKTTTPLQDKLAQVGKAIGIISIFICVGVFLLDWLVLDSSVVDSFKLAVSLAVAAIPEGLATVVTIVLSIGVQKMVKENAIVKKLPAVETLGSTSIVCSDKTGTLTQNKMTVLEVYDNGKLSLLSDLDQSNHELISHFALCCDAKIEVIDGVEKRIGDPTETALVELNNKYGVDISNVERVGEIPFDSDRKLMTVIVKLNGKYVSITKGAPDILLNRITNEEVMSGVDEAIVSMSKRALRCLALGIKVFDEMPEVTLDLEQNVELIGLVGMIDPPRPEVIEAINVAKKAGVRTIMITGDNIITASAIAMQLGILGEGQRAIGSEELDAMSDEELMEHIAEFSVYARVAPKDKVRIVTAWQAHGKVVAMTGDGVNDSPALKKADIGCAMGITGTDVSKEAADMILTDDNFSTIIKAVKQGRGIYDNIRKCVKYLLSSNIGEVLTILLALVITGIGLLSLGEPLAPIHLLWINLVTDSLPAFGLGMESPDDEIMLQKPRPKTEGFFANKLGLHIALEGVCVGLLTLTSYIIGETVIGVHEVGMTMAFVTLALAQLFHSYNVKSDHTIFHKTTFNNRMLNIAFVVGFVLQMAVVYTPGVNSIFQTVALSWDQLLIAIGLAFGMVVIMEVYKLVSNLVEKSQAKKVNTVATNNVIISDDSVIVEEENRKIK